MSQEETCDLSVVENDALDLHNRHDEDDSECLATLQYEGLADSGKLEIPLYPGQEIRIGRDRKCHYAIPDERVSKQHFRIYSIIYENKTSHDTETPGLPPLVYCEDLESSNGTYVNGVLIGIISHEIVGHLLCDGDVVEIRPYWKFRFHQPSHEMIFRDKAQFKDLEYFSDRYTVSDRILGAGRYGNVYLAKELATMKQIACKIVDLDLAMRNLSDSYRDSSLAGLRWKSGLETAKEERKRVLREIRILSKLSHPNVINLKKAFCTSRALYIFSDLAPAGDLFSYMQSHGGHLDDYNSRVITRQITLAVEYIHGKGIAHRDIKPENVLVTNTDFGGRVILTDFGFATPGNGRNGRMVSRLGTDGFVAPEVENVERTSLGYTMAADLWSLGVMTACLLTGDTMIPRKELSQLSQVEIAARFLEIKDSYTRHHWSNMPPRALKFIRRLLVVDPEERMTAAEALNHSWYTKPVTEAEALADGLKRINRFWKPREIFSDEVLEGLPRIVLTAATSADTSITKLRRKIPDTSMSPYFGLDRHLNQKMPSTKKRLLADLNESGTQFVTFQSPSKQIATANPGAQRDKGSSRVISVEGRDLFGMSAETKPAFSDFEELVDLIPTTPRSRIEEDQVRFDLGKSARPSTSPSESAGPSTSKRARKGPDAEDGRIQSMAAKQLPMPRYTPANPSRDTVSKISTADIISKRAFVSTL